MVNELQTVRDRAVRIEAAPERERRVSSHAGLGLIQKAARLTRLVSDAREQLAARKDPTQGFETAAVVLALIHGLLRGGEGWSATEPMRGDAGLLEALGLKVAPSAETVEEVVKYLALERDGREQANALLGLQARRCVERDGRSALLACDGFVPLWADGTLLEITGQTFDSVKTIKGRRGQMAVGAFVGPWAAGLDFAVGSEGEETVGRRLVTAGIERVLRPARLMGDALILLDSLYGDGPTFDQLDGYVEKPKYVVGVSKLLAAHEQLRDAAECQWRDTGPQPSRGWIESGVGQFWLRARDWSVNRVMVGRRWRVEGEMIWNYAGVVTNLTADDERVARLMRARRWTFEQAVWHLYSHKAGMENQWKDLLSDLELHHPPCAKAAVNAVFYALAGLAYNLSLAVRRWGLEGPSRRMRLWRLRSEVLAVAGYAVHHARTVVLRLVDARDHLVDQLLAAMGRLARL
jgi:hypothetical protein